MGDRQATSPQDTSNDAQESDSDQDVEIEPEVRLCAFVNFHYH